MLVITEESVVRAIAGRGGRSSMKRFTNSAAMCWASAALPPFPQIMSLRSAVNAWEIFSAKRDQVAAVLFDELLFDLDAFAKGFFYDSVHLGLTGSSFPLGNLGFFCTLVNLACFPLT